MARTIPVLGPAGFTKDLTIKADEAFSNFYITQASQTDMYRGGVVSLADLIRRYGDNALNIEREVQATLTSYLESQFDEVDLTVKANSLEDSIDLQITAILRDGNDSIDLHHVVSTADSKIRSIIDLQNNGRPVVQADLLSS